MAIVTYSARTALIQYLLSCPIHLGIGTGSSNWGSTPDPPDYEATSLIDEKGRKKLTRYFFVNEDDNGDISMPGGRKYKQSAVPTRQLYCHFVFDYGEGVADAIREVGIFINTKIKDGLPNSQTFFTPDQIKDIGTLVMLEHLETADTFTPTKKGGYETILTI